MISNADYGADPLAVIREIGVIRPGDTLLLSTERLLTHEQAAMIKDSVEKNMPNVDVVVVSGLTAIVQHASPNDGSKS